MSPFPWILISILILVIVLAIVAIFFKKKYKRPTDYYAFFLIGVIWTIFGIFAFFTDKNFTFFILGIIFLIIGLANRDKWKKNRVTWKKLTKPERTLRVWIMTILGILVLVGLIAFFIFSA